MKKRKFFVGGKRKKDERGRGQEKRRKELRQR